MEITLIVKIKKLDKKGMLKCTGSFYFKGHYIREVWLFKNPNSLDTSLGEEVIIRTNQYEIFEKKLFLKEYEVSSLRLLEHGLRP